MSKVQKVTHNIEPVFNENSRILILGSMPSAKSREAKFYYSNKQNRFWKVIAKVFEENEPRSIEEKKRFLIKNKIALWDVIKECDITGSDDSSIKNVVVNDLDLILEKCDIKQIYANGKAAEKYYNCFLKEKLSRDIIFLPSTSPANAAFNIERLYFFWKKLKNF